VKKLFIILLALLTGVSLFFGIIGNKKSDQYVQLTIVATTSMLADAVRTMVGDKVTVHCLMGCGVDPHLYRARESDVHKLAAAKWIVEHIIQAV
jgi:manganese/zinc/iron transport system substrate-binding protein